MQQFQPCQKVSASTFVPTHSEEYGEGEKELKNTSLRTAV